MKAYLSSTYVDLKTHRACVARALRKAGYEVTMMEEYVARDQRVEFACRGDVVACDVYIGLFAWRHGHVPDADNPQGLSVTEMEYEAAGAKPMTRLTFLVDEKARWPARLKDADPTRIEALRRQLSRRCSAYFATKDQLATEVLAAMRLHESTRLAQQIEAIDVLLQSQELGPSYMLNIQHRLHVLCDAVLLEFRIGPVPWWNTRLHLVAALARDFGRTRGFVFLDEDGRHVQAAAPEEVRHRLAQRWPVLEQAYALFRRDAPTLDKVEATLWRYPMCVAQACGVEERDAKCILTARDLAHGLGIATLAEVVDADGKGARQLQQDILGRHTPFVALLRDERLDGLVDCGALARRMAQTALAHLG